MLSNEESANKLLNQFVDENDDYMNKNYIKAFIIRFYPECKSPINKQIRDLQNLLRRGKLRRGKDTPRIKHYKYFVDTEFKFVEPEPEPEPEEYNYKYTNEKYTLGGDEFDNCIMFTWTDEDHDKYSKEFNNEDGGKFVKDQNWIKIVIKESGWKLGERLYIERKSNGGNYYHVWYYTEATKTLRNNCYYAYILNHDGKLFTQCFNNSYIDTCDDECGYTYYKILDSHYNLNNWDMSDKYKEQKKQALKLEEAKKYLEEREKKIKKEKQQEKFVEKWIDENDCHDTTASSWIKQEEDEWGTRCLCLAGGGSHTLYVEHDEIQNKWRYNWVCRHETQMLDALYCINDGEGGEWFTDIKPPKRMMNDDKLYITNMTTYHEE